MPARVWKRVGGELHGRGNGYHAIVYKYTGQAENKAETFLASINKGETYVASKTHMSEAAAKRWAESYIKGI